MGFNKPKTEDARKSEAEKEAAARRELDPQILEDAERLIADWNERQAKRAPMPFSPTIGAALAALVLVGAAPGLPHHERDRPTHVGPSSRRVDHNPRAVLPVVPTECTFCRAAAAVAAERAGRMQSGAGQGSAWAIGYREC